MTRHLATFRSPDKRLLASMLVSPNMFTHRLAVKQGLDCTLRNRNSLNGLWIKPALPIFEYQCQPTPFQSLRDEGNLFAVLHFLRIGPGSELITIGAGN